MKYKWIVIPALVAAACLVAAGQKNGDLGFKDTPVLPGQPWHVHDSDRPHPRAITPGTPSTQEHIGTAPSDAIVLFDGKDLSHWQSSKGGPPGWKLENGYVEVVDGTGDLMTKEKFGTAQYHVEWAAPPEIKGSSQSRGNSGFLIMSRYEIQVLDCYENPTYADGWAGAIYGQWPPLVSPCRKPGEWQTYDIIFEAPQFDGDKVKKPANVTVLFNGVVVQNHKDIIGAMVYRRVAHYTPHAAEEPLMLQNHHEKVRYRYVWVRPLGSYS